MGNHFEKVRLAIFYQVFDNLFGDLTASKVIG